LNLYSAAGSGSLDIGICSPVRRELSRSAIQKHFERLKIEHFKRLHDNIGGQMLATAAYTDAPHPRPSRSFDSGGGVFYDDGSGG